MSPLIDAMWSGSDCSDWATSRPRTSMMEAEWSRRSLMFVE